MSITVGRYLLPMPKALLSRRFPLTGTDSVLVEQ